MADANSGGGEAPAGRSPPSADDSSLRSAAIDETIEATPDRVRPSQPLRTEAAFLETEASVSVTGPADVQLPARFRLLRSLGSGGMGEVVLAHDNVLGRDVAIKVLKPGAFGDRALRDRLLNEAQAAAQIRHPHIVSIHDVDLDAGLIVMEHLSSGSGRTLIEQRGRLSLKEVLPIARSLCSALQAAHAAGLVHRDIKPDNVLFDADGRVKLADFGVALSRRKTTSGGSEIVGTPAYMAPEQLRGADPDPRADIYALGLTIYELASGRRFHTPEGPGDSSVGGLTRAVGDRGLARVLARCLAEDPAHRFGNAAELEAALDDLARRRQRIRAGLMAAAIAAVVALPLAIVLPRGGPSAAVAVLKVATLPFENRTAETRLAWLAQGFANLLSSSLRRRGVPAVRHEWIRDQTGHVADPARWAEAARSAGASDFVTGWFEKQGGALRVSATLRGKSYEARGPAARADAIADEIAASIARDLVGEPPQPQRRGRSPEAMRRYEMGYAALQQHEFQKAVEQLQEAIRLDPDYVDARYALITARSSMGAPSRALVAEVDDALSHAMSGRERALFETLRMRLLRRYDEAAARYDKLVSQYPMEKEAHFGLADSLFHLGRYSQALSAFRRLVKLAPAFHLAYQHPVEWLGTRARTKDLTWYLYQLRRTSPPASFLALMEVRLEMARRRYRRALERARRVANPQPELLAEMGGVQAVMGEVETARELYAQASALSPDNWKFRIARVGLDLIQGQLADFHEDAVWAATSRMPVSTVADRLATRGMLYAMLGRIEEARRDAREVRSLVGPEMQRRMPQYLFLEGFVHWADADPNGLSRIEQRLRMEDARERAGRPGESRPFVAGARLAAAGNAAAALKKFREAHEAREGPDFAPIYLLAIARVAMRADNKAAAAKACDEILRPPAVSHYRAPAVPPCLGILAQVRAAQGRRNEAVRHARELLKLWRQATVEIPELAAARRIAAEGS